MSKTKTTGKGVAALIPEETPKETKSQRDARRKREKRAEAKIDRIDPGSRAFRASFAAGVENVSRVNESTVRVTFAKPDADEPIPMRLTLAALAEAFDDACTAVDCAEQELNDAVNKRLKARQALDQAMARRANGERA